MLHFKLMGMEHRAPCKHIFCPYIYPWPLGGAKGHNILLLKVVMLHIKLKGMEHQAPCKPYPVLTHTLHPQIWSKGLNIFSESSQCAYQMKDIEHHSSTCSVFTHTLGWSQNVKTFFSESSHVAYKIKGNGAYRTTQAHILSLNTS